MSDRFLKFIPSKEAMWLLKNKGHAFRLLTIIAESARRYEGDPDGLKIGECFIGGYENYDMSERNYRTAKETLEKRRHMEIVETCRTRKKSTTGVTTVGTKVKLISSTVWDINLQGNDDRSDDCPTTDRRPTDDKLRMINKEKEDHPSIPSLAKPVIDDFSFSEKIEIVPGIKLSQADLDACVRLKGSLEKAQEAISAIQANPKRKTTISDWPNALMKWKPPTKSKPQLSENVWYTEKLCKEFAEFTESQNWRCSMYNDTQKDQRGILFENSRSTETLFVALVDGELSAKCEEFVNNKNMRKNGKL